MNRPILFLFSFFLVGCVAAQSPYKPSPIELRNSYRRANSFQSNATDAVFKTTLVPHWFGDDCFWYRNDLKGKAKEFVIVEAASAKKRPAFDPSRLAEVLGKATGEKIDPQRLPFDSISPSDDLKTLGFTYKGDTYELDLIAYTLSKLAASKPVVQSSGRPRRDGTSPDGLMEAQTADGQVRVREKTGDWVSLTKEGGFTDFTWAEDSKHLLAFRQIPGDHKLLYLLHSTGDGKTRATLETRMYDQPGDKLDTYAPFVLDVGTRTEAKVPIDPITGGGYPWPGAPSVRPWNGGFLLDYPVRGYGAFEVVKIDATSAKATTLVDEKSTTFVDTTHNVLHPLEKSHDLLWRSERSGWARLYLVDGETGAIKNAVTPDGVVMKEVVYVDEDKGQVFFTAQGFAAGQDPYHVHYCRVNLDGTGLVQLTQGDGTHSVEFSPDKQFYVDSYSRVDMPPVHELHRSSDGHMTLQLEKADISGLLKNGVRLPERFVAKGRDGKTDIWGIVVRPTNFDLHRKYPVIENIYAGPHDSFVPKKFAPFLNMNRLAELGFIVVQIDGMGTDNRGKKFHDVCFKNIADAGFPDRILWMQALAKKMPQADISRVGVYGTSAGGQNAAGAVLWHPEFYKAAVASCGCHDNRIDKQWWNEQWMGYPVGPEYAEQSNITNAAKLKGHLMLFVSEDDHNVPPESTMRFVDALIKANKEFEYLMLPALDHSDGGPYGERKRRDFFVRWLLGVTPPDWNAQ